MKVSSTIGLLLLLSGTCNAAFFWGIFSTSKSMKAKARGEGYGQLLEDISETVGNTPVVKINDRLCPPGRTIYAKCEFFNPLSSVKDRLALSIIETAEKEGKLKPGDTVVEATSGNTGIAVAMMCAQRGYGCVITMAEPFSIERRKLMRMLGAKVIITPKVRA
jgi:cysteine synthase